MSDVDAVLAQKAEGLRPGSFRHAVLLAARRFKSTWVELGKVLIKVRDQASYEEWGYSTFESYCAQELHIRKQTALKLTRSFSFLRKHEPKQLHSQDLVDRVPAFEVVEVLAEAEERGQLSAAEYRAIRDSIWDPQKPSSELKRELAQRFPRPSLPARGELRQIARAARRLVRQLESCEVPRATVERADALASELEELAIADE
jgi:hypothetical protein